jgi:hypothetical protein
MGLESDERNNRNNLEGFIHIFWYMAFISMRGENP